MYRVLLILAILAGLSSGATALAGTVDLPEIGDNLDKITFQDSAFAVSYTVLTGIVNLPGDALGYDVSTYASIGGAGKASASASMRITFSSNLINGDGIDLWLYKVGTREGFNLTIGNTTKRVGVAWTHETRLPHGYDVNLAKIDLSDYGFGVGDTGVDSFVMSSWYHDVQKYWTTPDLAAAATDYRNTRAIAIPLPSAGLMGLGLLALSLAGRTLRRRRR